jgi:hypothetical protein
VIYIIVVIALAIVGIAILAAAVKIVRPFQRGLVERLGKYKATKDPGLQLILPFIDSMRLIDMREQVVDVPPQEVITADNVVVSVDAVVYYEATDPQRLVYNVADFFTAITKLAQTNLRNLVGDSARQGVDVADTINTSCARCRRGDRPWGVKVVRVESNASTCRRTRVGDARPDAPSASAGDGHDRPATARRRSPADGEQQSAVLPPRDASRRRSWTPRVRRARSSCAPRPIGPG